MWDCLCFSYERASLKVKYLGGDLTHFAFSPLPGGDDPIWQAYCSDGLVEPPTRYPFLLGWWFQQTFRLDQEDMKNMPGFSRTDAPWIQRLQPKKCFFLTLHTPWLYLGRGPLLERFWDGFSVFFRCEGTPILTSTLLVSFDQNVWLMVLDHPFGGSFNNQFHVRGFCRCPSCALGGFFQFLHNWCCQTQQEHCQTGLGCAWNIPWPIQRLSVWKTNF